MIQKRLAQRMGRGLALSVCTMMVLVLMGAQVMAVGDPGVSIDGRPEGYHTIQAAIDAAQAGETVRVGPGDYPEALRIETSDLTLISDEGAEIQGEGNEGSLIFIDATGVTIQGFTIAPINGGTETGIEFNEGASGYVIGCDFHGLAAGVGSDTVTATVEVIECSFTAVATALAVDQAIGGEIVFRDNEIYGNCAVALVGAQDAWVVITDNTYAGGNPAPSTAFILSDWANTEGLFAGNVVNGNRAGEGLVLNGIGADAQLLIRDNEWSDLQVAIDVWGPIDNATLTITDNEIIDVEDAGILFWESLTVATLTIADNTFRSTDGYQAGYPGSQGILLRGIRESHVTIAGNVIDQLDEGVVIGQYSNLAQLEASVYDSMVRILDNHIESLRAIRILGALEASTLDVGENVIEGSGYQGIYLGMTSGFSATADIRIENNTVRTDILSTQIKGMAAAIYVNTLHAGQLDIIGNTVEGFHRAIYVSSLGDRPIYVTLAMPSVLVEANIRDNILVHNQEGVWIGTSHNAEVHVIDNHIYGGLSNAVERRGNTGIYLDQTSGVLSVEDNEVVGHWVGIELSLGPETGGSQAVTMDILPAPVLESVVQNNSLEVGWSGIFARVDENAQLTITGNEMLAAGDGLLPSATAGSLEELVQAWELGNQEAYHHGFGIGFVAAGEVTVTDNEVTGPFEMAIACEAYQADMEVSWNRVAGTGWGLVAWPTSGERNLTVSGNWFSGFAEAAVVLDGYAGQWGTVTLTGNRFTDSPTGTGIDMYRDDGCDFSGFIIMFNEFRHDGPAIVVTEAESAPKAMIMIDHPELDISSNWWGHADGLRQGQTSGPGVTFVLDDWIYSAAIHPQLLELNVGQQGALTLMATLVHHDQEKSVKAVDGRFARYDSSDPSIARVSQQGLVTKTGLGTATISSLFADGAEATVRDAGPVYDPMPPWIPTTPWEFDVTESRSFPAGTGGEWFHDYARFTLTVPPEAAGSEGELIVTVTTRAGDQEPQAWEDLDVPEDFTLIKRSFDFLARLIKDGEEMEVRRFAPPLVLTVHLTAYEMERITDPAKVGLYLVMPDGSMRFVGGRLVGNDLVVKLHSFSRFVVGSTERTFDDIVGHWARADIELMAARHVVRGYPDGQFAPEGLVTRAEFAVMLARALELPLEQGALGFTDVEQTAWYYQPLQAAVSAGLITGYDDGTFGPGDLITREQLATMIGRALLLSGQSEALDEEAVEEWLAEYADGQAVKSWARGAMALAIAEGIVTGKSAQQLVPGAHATRAEAATMLARFWRQAE